MKITTDLFQETIEIDEGEVVSLVIEDKKLHLELLKRINGQMQGVDNGIILSNKNEIIKFQKVVDFFSVFPLPDINEKRILSKLLGALEEEALNEKNYSESMELLGQIERFIYNISDNISYNIDCSNSNIGTVLKSFGIHIVEDCESDLEQILSYMTIVNELLGEKLFILVNMKLYFDDSDLALFSQMVETKKQYVLLIDGIEGNRINGIKQIVIDKDLCVF